MLLKEGHTNITDTCPLHYVVAYCDAKTTTRLLDLAIADVNHRNPRGYTVLYLAAMRKDPKLIVSLLIKGAKPTALTSDGTKALKISKRLSRAVDTEQGRASPKDMLCVEILEQAERIDPLLGEASASLANACADIQNKLYLEIRVGLAKLLFPMEAQMAMDIAQVDGTSEYTLPSFEKEEENLIRIRALSETGMDTS